MGGYLRDMRQQAAHEIGRTSRRSESGAEQTDRSGYIPPWDSFVIQVRTGQVLDQSVHTDGVSLKAHEAVVRQPDEGEVDCQRVSSAKGRLPVDDRRLEQETRDVLSSKVGQHAEDVGCQAPAGPRCLVE